MRSTVDKTASFTNKKSQKPDDRSPEIIKIISECDPSTFKFDDSNGLLLTFGALAEFLQTRDQNLDQGIKAPRGARPNLASTSDDS